MTTFKQFATLCKVRHDYGDMIQVRYHHSNGEDYDTWVSGNEVIQRLRSESAEERLRRLSELDLDTLRQTVGEAPQAARDWSENMLIERAADEFEDFLGDNVISESLADVVRGDESLGKSDDSDRTHWRSLLMDTEFRTKVVELAWIQLEGSFPDEQSEEEPDDWM